MALGNYTAPSVPKMGRSTFASSTISGAGIGALGGGLGSDKISPNKPKLSISDKPKLTISKVNFQSIKSDDIDSSLAETNIVLVEIQKQLALDFANRISERKEKISAIKKQRDNTKKMARESSVESPLAKISKKTSGALNKVMAPAKNIFDKIIEFLSLIGTGILVEEAFRWFSKKENRDAISKVFTFLVDNWKILAGIFIGGKILSGILKLVGAARVVRGLLRKIGLLKNKGICGCGDGPGRTPTRLPRAFAATRGSGMAFSRFFRAGANQAPIGRMGSLINESTGRATRMLGPNKAVDALARLKNAGVGNANRARVMAGQLSETQALNIATKNKGLFSGIRQNFGGMLAQGNNLRRGVVSQGQALVGGVYRGVKGFGSDVMNVGRTVGKGLMDAGGAAVSGLKSSWDNVGKTISNLDPRKLPQIINTAVKSEVGKLQKASPIFKKLINLVKNPKDIATLVTDVAGKAKPAVQAIKQAKRSVPFRIPGVDVLISSLIAAVEIGTGGPAGNALMGALGGVLGSAAGTTIGSFGGPPGALIGAMAGGVGGELLFRAAADKIGEQLAENGKGDFGRGIFNDSPLFVSGYDPFAMFGSDDEAPEGKKFGGGMIKGPSHGGGGVKMGGSEVEGGEYVVNRKDASRNKASLDDINFNSGRQLKKFGEGVKMQKTLLKKQEDNQKDFGEITEKLVEEFEKKKRIQEEKERNRSTSQGLTLLEQLGMTGNGSGGGNLSGNRGGSNTGNTGLNIRPSGGKGPQSLEVTPYRGPSASVIPVPPIVEPEQPPEVISGTSDSNSGGHEIIIKTFDTGNEYIAQAYQRYGIFM